MTVSWIVAIEQEGEYLFAEKYHGSAAYILALLKIARLVDEKLPKASIGVGELEAKGVVGGYIDWKREERYRKVEPKVVKDLADAARHVGLNYE